MAKHVLRQFLLLHFIVYGRLRLIEISLRDLIFAYSVTPCLLVLRIFFITGLARLECITEHSSIPCKKIYRETRSTVTIRTKSVVNLDSVEIIRLSDGRIAAALEFYNALTTLLNLRAESVAGSTDEARVGNTRDLSETMVDPNHRAVLIVPVRASEVSMPLSLHPTKLRFDVHWNAIAAGNRGVVTFCVAPTGTEKQSFGREVRVEGGRAAGTGCFLPTERECSLYFRHTFGFKSPRNRLNAVYRWSQNFKF